MVSDENILTLNENPKILTILFFSLPRHPERSGIKHSRSYGLPRPFWVNAGKGEKKETKTRVFIWQEYILLK